MDNIDFNKNLNISYVDENTPEPSKSLILKHCICSSIIYIFMYLLLLTNPFFSKHCNLIMKSMFEFALISYILLAPIIYLKFKPKTVYKSHSIEVFNYIKRILKINWKDSSPNNILKSLEPTYYEKQSVMLFFIKFFFGTIMTYSLIQNLTTITNLLIFFKKIFLNISNFDFYTLKYLITRYSTQFYRLIILVLFAIDLAYFVFGYLTECSFLKNKIRAVETSFLGIFFCLACYPPFNHSTTTILGWNQSNMATAFNDPTSALTWSFRIIALVFLVLYVAASIALGTKASNLTNRGIVSKFPYNIVRHPAYISKNIFWLLTTIPLLLVNFNSSSFILHKYLIHVFLVFCTFIFWCGIYYFRAIYEEKFLLQDPDYQEYVKKVKYRFIPYII